MSKYETYRNPLETRYASREMLKLWSPQTKFETWRLLWIYLAEAELELGISAVTQAQIDEMRRFQTNINFDVAEAREKETRHDVMSHVYAFGVQCPQAKGIIHLGSTSAYVQDNTDLILLKRGMGLILGKLRELIRVLASLVEKWKEQPILAKTHLQPAQLTTLGKRIAGWLADLVEDEKRIRFEIDALPFLGAKGATGTQASFLELFANDGDKVEALDDLVRAKAGFSRLVLVCGQTYSRKADDLVARAVCGIADSSAKMFGDVRHMAAEQEVAEPFKQESQVGSSAMPHKRNPILSERVCSLATYALNLSHNSSIVYRNQWLERTLDDSAVRRMYIPELFLAIDAILVLSINIMKDLDVRPAVIRRNIMKELPFLATENILMNASRKGGDRQELHEELRRLSLECRHRMNFEGADNDLLERIAQHPSFGSVLEEMKSEDLLNPQRYVGRAPALATKFLNEEVRPILDKLDAKDSSVVIPEIHV